MDARSRDQRLEDAATLALLIAKSPPRCETSRPSAQKVRRVKPKPREERLTATDMHQGTLMAQRTDLSASASGLSATDLHDIRGYDVRGLSFVPARHHAPSACNAALGAARTSVTHPVRLFRAEVIRRGSRERGQGLEGQGSHGGSLATAVRVRKGFWRYREDGTVERTLEREWVWTDERVVERENGAEVRGKGGGRGGGDGSGDGGGGSGGRGVHFHSQRGEEEARAVAGAAQRANAVDCLQKDEVEAYFAVEDAEAAEGGAVRVGSSSGQGAELARGHKKRVTKSDTTKFGRIVAVTAQEAQEAQEVS